jgi:hypothetical protein
LRSLDLSDTQVTDAGLKELKELKNLRSLDLPKGSITDARLRTLREIGMLHALVQATAQDGKRPSGPADVVALDLTGTEMTDAGLKELKELKNLLSLNLRATRVTDAGSAELQNALPKLKIRR